MTPQKPGFNSGIWKKLETEIRKMNEDKKILETYVIAGPIFYFDKPVASIGDDDSNEVTIPNACFKSVLTENNRGTLRMWSFVITNKASTKELDEFIVPTTLVEKLAGIKLWERLVGKKIDKEKRKVREMW